MLLQRLYPSIKLPKFSAHPFQTANGKIFIRTSPKKSIAGLLNSKLVDNNTHSISEALSEIEADFKKYLGVLSEQYLDGSYHDDNELHTFYQEFIEGANGVCHFYKEGEFRYALSEKQGDIVLGKKTSVTLEPKIYNELRKIAKGLYEDFGDPIQLEFVVSNDTLYIVQLRLLQNNPNNIIVDIPLDAFVKGQSFSAGYVEVDVADILVVNEDAESSQLIGKKALIVIENVEFSHILALSKALQIPSMFNVRGIDKLPTSGKVVFSTNYLDGFIRPATES